MKRLCTSCGGDGLFKVPTNGISHQCGLCNGRGAIDDGTESTAPAVALHVSPMRLEEVISSEHYWLVPGTFMTVCALVLKNGFTVLGASACATIEQFDAMTGRRVARKNAVRELAPHECYALRNEVLGKP